MTNLKKKRCTFYDTPGIEKDLYNYPFLRLLFSGNLKSEFKAKEFNDFHPLTHNKVILKENSIYDMISILIMFVRADQVNNPNVWSSFLPFTKTVSSINSHIPNMVVITHLSSIIPEINENPTLLAEDNRVQVIRSIASEHSNLNPGFIHFALDYFDKPTVDLHVNYSIFKILDKIKSLTSSYLEHITIEDGDTDSDSDF